MQYIHKYMHAVNALSKWTAEECSNPLQCCKQLPGATKYCFNSSHQCAMLRKDRTSRGGLKG